MVCLLACTDLELTADTRDRRESRDDDYGRDERDYDDREHGRDRERERRHNHRDRDRDDDRSVEREERRRERVSAVWTRVDSTQRPRVTHLPSAPEFPSPRLAPHSSPLSLNATGALRAARARVFSLTLPFPTHHPTFLVVLLPPLFTRLYGY